MAKPIMHQCTENDLLRDCIGLGFCRACGEEADGVEPDARKYKCDSCGELAVYGISVLLLVGEVELIEEDD